MRYKKPFLVVCTAIILVCSIPISACAVGTLSLQDADLQYFRNNSAENMGATKNSPGFHLVLPNYETCGYVHCTRGSWFSFVIFIPFMGYWLCVFQNTTVPKDIAWRDTGTGELSYGCYQIRHDIAGNNSSWRSYYFTYYVEGGWSTSGLAGLHSILGQYVFFYPLNNNGQTTVSDRVSYQTSNYGLPSDEQKFLDEVDGLLDSYNMTHDDPVILKGQGSVDNPTYPDGSPAPTNSAGNPAPTNEFGQTMPTLPNGKPVPTYPNGNPAEYYTDSSGVYHTVPYTIYDNADNASDVNDKFSKLNDMISDLDDLSSIMESNQSDLSSHVDDTRGLIETVTSWLPTPIIACMVCGAIMIIAVKIAGSGKS